jgi:hypothetical protein
VSTSYGGRGETFPLSTGRRGVAAARREESPREKKGRARWIPRRAGPPRKRTRCSGLGAPRRRSGARAAAVAAHHAVGALHLLVCALVAREEPALPRI